MNTVRLNVVGTLSGGLEAVMPPDYYYKNYFTIEALEDGLTVTPSLISLEYCLNGDGKWVSLPPKALSPAISAGEKISFRYKFDVYSFRCVISKKCNIQGDVLSIIHGEDYFGATTMPIRALRQAFYGQPIVSAANLILPPFTSEYCYDEMFRDCTSLVHAPSLPSMELANSCYSGMYTGCTSLIHASALPAMNLADYCYQKMYSGCTSLQVAPVLPALEFKTRCYSQMYTGCSSLNLVRVNAVSGDAQLGVMAMVTSTAATGIFIKNSKASWSDSYLYAPEGWSIITLDA